MEPSTRRLLIASLLFILIRLVILQQYFERNPFSTYPIIDSALYLDWAEAILQGKSYFALEYHHPPGYALFLSVVLKISGNNLFAVLFLQSLMVSLQGLMVFGCARRLSGTASAWVAFVLFSLCGPIVFYSMKILSETLYTTALLGSFYFLLRAVGAHGVRPNSSREGACHVPLLVATGALLGIAIEVRGNAMLCLIPAVVAVLVAEKTAFKRIASCAVLMAGVSILVLPVLWRNISVAGVWSPSASNWGENFYFGNSPYATGGVPAMPGISRNLITQIDDVRMEASRRAGRPLNSIEAQRFWFREGLEFIQSDPLRWIRLEWQKLLRLMSRNLPSGMFFYDLETRYFQPSLGFFAISFVFIIPLFFLGLLGTPRISDIGLLLGFIAAQVFLLLLFWAEERYFVPVIPFLLIVAGNIVHLRRKSFARDAKTAFCITGIAVWLLANLFPHPGTNGREAWYANASSALFARGDLQTAFEMAKLGIETDAKYADAWINLGAAYHAMGQKEKSRDAWKRSLELHPEDLVALRNLALSYETENRRIALEWWNRTLVAARKQRAADPIIRSIEGRIRELETQQK